MQKKLEEALFDSRVVQKNIARGVVDKKDYEEMLKSLPDDSKNSLSVPAFNENEALTFSSVEPVKA